MQSPWGGSWAKKILAINKLYFLPALGPGWSSFLPAALVIFPDTGIQEATVVVFHTCPVMQNQLHKILIGEREIRTLFKNISVALNVPALLFTSVCHVSCVMRHNGDESHKSL